MGDNVGQTKKRRRLTIALALAAAGLGAAPAMAAKTAKGPDAFECRFENGATWAFDKGAFRAEATSGRLAFAISGIDRKRQTARLETGKGSAALKIVRALDATHFLEVTVAGYLAITTIYDCETAGGARPAVHSRHLGIVGQPLIAQYRGLCRPRP